MRRLSSSRCPLPQTLPVAQLVPSIVSHLAYETSDWQLLGFNRRIKKGCLPTGLKSTCVSLYLSCRVLHALHTACVRFYTHRTAEAHHIIANLKGMGTKPKGTTICGGIYTGSLMGQAAVVSTTGTFWFVTKHNYEAASLYGLAYSCHCRCQPSSPNHLQTTKHNYEAASLCGLAHTWHCQCLPCIPWIPVLYS